MRTVLRSKDFRRVEALPRRDWASDGASQIYALSNALRTPKGSMRLRLVQACALAEIAQLGGIFAPIGVGHGKTLISLLAPQVLESKRPLLIVPAQLRTATVSRYCRELSEHWQIPDSFCDGSRVLSYGALSTQRGLNLLEELKPDLIICDEVHYLKSLQSARTKRFMRYMKANPETGFIGMSGTVTKKSIREYWHLIKLALPESCPLPLRWIEMSDWANALDENVRPELRCAPGALRHLCAANETPRDGYRRRLTETPGVIATRESELGTSLLILKQRPELPTAIDDALRQLRSDWVTPSGEDVSDSLDYYRKARELAFGFFYRWVWCPSVSQTQKADWLRARSEWRQLVRQKTKSPKTDTEFLVWRAYSTGILKRDSDIFHNWRALKESTPLPATEAVWFCDEMLHRITLSKEPCFVWVDSKALGHKLMSVCELPYYGASQYDTQRLLSHIDTGSGHAIVSIQAHSVGKNLQRFAQSLVLTPPGSGATWEQLLGRLHRPGQQADQVVFRVWTHTKELENSFDQALDDASYIETTLGSRQKLSYANILDESA